MKSSIPTYIRYRLYVKLIFLCYIYMYYIYNILINSSPLLPRAVLRCPVAKSDCADGQMQQPKEQGFHCNILVHCIAMNYVEWCLPSVSNSFPHHNVSTMQQNNIFEQHNSLQNAHSPCDRHVDDHQLYTSRISNHR